MYVCMYVYTYLGQPSNVDTVNNVNIAFATSSKWKRFLSQLRSFITGLSMTPSSNTKYVPLKLSTIINDHLQTFSSICDYYLLTLRCIHLRTICACKEFSLKIYN